MIGLAIIVAFAYQLEMAPHLDRRFAFAATATILAIGFIGAGALIQRPNETEPDERFCPHCGEPLDD